MAGTESAGMDEPTAVSKRTLLERASFGERIAEDETQQLATYFVETDQWRRLYSGERDIVYGTKGSGKSALYSLLVQKSEELFDRDILLVTAENQAARQHFATSSPNRLRRRSSSSRSGSSTSCP